MMFDKILLTFGKGELGLTYEIEKGYVIVNILSHKSTLKQGELIDFKKDKGVHSVKNSYILCGDLKSLISKVQLAKTDKTKRVIEFKNFILDFSDANLECMDLFIKICVIATKDQSVNLVL